MGLRQPYLHFIEASIEKAFVKTGNLRMLELGDQVIHDPAIPEKTGKAYFESRGFEHVSVDLNGRHGALDRLGPGPLALIGHSQGGIDAVACAAQHDPERRTGDDHRDHKAHDALPVPVPKMACGHPTGTAGYTLRQVLPLT